MWQYTIRLAVWLVSCFNDGVFASPFVRLGGTGCEVVNNGFCIVSTRRRRFGLMEHCDVRVTANMGPISVYEFNLPASFSWLEVNTKKFRNNVGPEGEVPYFIHWTSQMEYEHEFTGWALCANAVSPQIPALPLPSQQVGAFMKLSGTGCEVFGEYDHCLTSSRRRRYEEWEHCHVQVADGVGEVFFKEMDTENLYDNIFINNRRFSGNYILAPGIVRPSGVVRWSSEVSEYTSDDVSGWTICVKPPYQEQEQELVGNLSDMVMGAWNGADAAFDYPANATAGTVAKLACESAHGNGACVQGSCGCFSYFYREGAMTCSCAEEEGEYQWVFDNRGCDSVSQDLSGEKQELTGLLTQAQDNVFVRRRAKGCSLGSWELSLRSIGPEQLLPHRHLVLDFRASQYVHGSGTWSSIAPLAAGAAATVPGTPFDEEEQAFAFGAWGGGDIISLGLGPLPTMTWSLWAKLPLPEVRGSGILMAARTKFSNGVRIIPRMIDLGKLKNGLPANEWHHIVSVFGQSETLLFINGRLQMVEAPSYDPMPQGEEDYLTIGGWDAPGESVHGTWSWISDVAVFNRILSAEEIRNLFNTGRPSSGGTSTREQPSRKCKHYGSLAQAAAALSAVPAPSGSPPFEVLRGDFCYVEGNCVATSRRRRGNYESEEQCDIAVHPEAGPLAMHEFVTEIVQDFMEVTSSNGNASMFSGWKGPDGFQNASRIFWSSNWGIKYVERGWKICASEQIVDEDLHAAKLYLDCLRYNSEDADSELLQELTGSAPESCSSLARTSGCQGQVGPLSVGQVCPSACNATPSSGGSSLGLGVASPVPVWLVEGGCAASSACVASPYFPLAAAGNESCLLQAPPLMSTFTTWPEQRGDYRLSVDGAAYDDLRHPPAGARLVSSVAWSAGSQPTPGWKICSAVGSCGGNCAPSASVSCQPRVQGCGGSFVSQALADFLPASLARRPFAEVGSCNDAAFVELDLGLERTLAEVSLLSMPGEGHCGRGVHIARDGGEWLEVFRQGSGYGPAESELGTVMPFLPQSARYIRIFSGRSQAEGLARFLTVRASGTCEDDAGWTDARYGDGSMTCKMLASHKAWCYQRSFYSMDAQKACPRTCGDCGKAFEPLGVNQTCLPTNTFDETQAEGSIESALACFWHCLLWAPTSHFKWEPGQSCKCFQGCGQPLPSVGPAQTFSILGKNIPHAVTNKLEWFGYVYWSNQACASNIESLSACLWAAELFDLQYDYVYVDGAGLVCRYQWARKRMDLQPALTCSPEKQCLCWGRTASAVRMANSSLTQDTLLRTRGLLKSVMNVGTEETSTWCRLANPKLCRGKTRTLRRKRVPIRIGPGVFPFPVDWDGDGDKDMVLGRGDGRLVHFENYGGALDLATAVGVARTTSSGSCLQSWWSKELGNCSHWCCDITGFGDVCNNGNDDRVACDEARSAFGISASSAAVPVAFDWDRDSDVDLLIASCDGSLEYWRRDGPHNLTKVNAEETPFSNVGHNPLQSSGCLYPELVDWDDDGDLDLLLGLASGHILYFENLGAIGYHKMEGARNPFFNVVVEGMAVPSATDWDGDGDVDLLVGSVSGTVQIFERTEHGTLVDTGALPNVQMTSNSIPRAVDWDQNGEVDLLVADGGTGDVWLWLSHTANVLTQRLSTMSPVDDIAMGRQAFPQLVDVDGRWGLFVGDHTGRISKYEIDDNGIFKLNSSDILGAGDGGDRGGMAFQAVDWDGDGDLDFLAGQEGGVLLYHEYDALSRRFHPGRRVHAGSLGTFPAPHAIDWDGDGDVDLVLGDSGEVPSRHRLRLDGFPEPAWNDWFTEQGPAFFVGGRHIFATDSKAWVIAYCEAGAHWSIVANTSGDFAPGAECGAQAMARRSSKEPPLLDKGYLHSPNHWEVRGTFFPQAEPEIPWGKTRLQSAASGAGGGPLCDTCNNRAEPECGCELSRAMQNTCARELCNFLGYDSGKPQSILSIPFWKCSCQDLDEKGKIMDAYGKACDDYEKNPTWCGRYDHLPGSFNSTEMCCACGGGESGDGTNSDWSILAVCYNWASIWTPAYHGVVAEVDPTYGRLGQGSLRYFERTAPDVLVERFGAENPFSGVEVFGFTRPFPFIVDWDRDGVNDLVLGSDSQEVKTLTPQGCMWLDIRAETCTWDRTSQDVCAVSLCRAAGFQRGTLLDSPDLCGDGTLGIASGLAVDVQQGGFALPQPWSRTIFPRVRCEGSGIRFFQGTANGTLKEKVGEENPFGGVAPEGAAVAQVVDFDSDGEWDVVVGDNGGKLRYFQHGETCQAGEPCRGAGLCHPVLGSCGCVTGHGLSDCSRCMDGYYSSLAGRAAIGDCLPCPGLGSEDGLCAGRGTCSDDSTARQEAIRNAGGSNSSISLAFGSGECACSPYFFGEDSLGLSSCALGECPPGMELGSVGACVPCQPGYGKSLIGNHLCELCPSGRYTDSSGSSTCNACPSGRFQERAGQDSCQLCLRATFSGNGSSVCLDCPIGRYADEVEMSECSACIPGTWSSDPGAEQCQPCEAGKAGSGAAPCQPCTSGSYAEVPGTSTCTLCGRGRYSSSTEATSSGTCLPCGLGKFSEAPGLEAQDLCLPCPRGATTAEEGADNSSLCVQPAKGNFSCVSGRFCHIAVMGNRLQPGHQLALQSGAATGLVPKSVSKPTGDGSSYGWLEPLVLDGGTYELLWCPGIHGPCADTADFGFQIGHLEVTGPVPASFLCIRGQACEALGPVAGVGLLSTDRLQVQGSCGLGPVVPLSETSKHGLAVDVGTASGGIAFGFGSDAVSVNPHEAYQVCWCATSQDGACSGTGDFLVPAGSLRIEGPRTGHEVTCWLGQHCQILGIGGIGLSAGDQLMILETCGVPGQFIKGVPGGGVAELAADAADFEFLPLAPAGALKVLQSFPGLYRVCFCRKAGSGACASSADFAADTGLFAANGPYSDQAYSCVLGTDCLLRELQGIGLEDGDAIEVQQSALPSCGGNSSNQHPAGLASPLAVAFNRGKDFSLGALPRSGAPGRYGLCWRPKGTSVARALLGFLEVTCPAGSYRVVTQEASKCAECPLGFFCEGGTQGSKVRCGAGRTTLGKGAQRAEECLCDAGFSLEGGECIACQLGRYKVLIANNDTCPGACPNGTTSIAGARSAKHCYSPFTDVSGSNLSQAAVYVVEGALRIPACLTDDELRETKWQLRQTLAHLLLVLESDILLSFPEESQSCSSPTNASSAERLLQEQELTQLVTYKVSQASEAEARRVLANINLADIQAELLSSVGIAVNGGEAPVLSSTLLDCSVVGPGMSFPPGGRPTSLDECTCTAGHERDPLTSLCAPCAVGLFKDSAGDQPCSLCKVAAVQGDVSGTVRLTTPFAGAAEERLCICPAGYYDNKSSASPEHPPAECLQCGLGHICPGGSARKPCPPGTTTDTETAGDYTGCICDAGYAPLIARNETHRCSLCEPGVFKSQKGDVPCSQDCPANRRSEPGATSSLDCFCSPGYYHEAHTDLCQLCPPEGVLCPGGFEDQSRRHVEPTSLRGYYMVGYAIAEECFIYDEEDGRSLCLEGASASNQSSACGGSQTGVLCGACQHLSTRDIGDEPCEPCEDAIPDWIHIFYLNVDLLLKAGFGIFLGKQAMDSSAEATKMEAVILRILLQWTTACSVLASFDLSSTQLFDWSTVDGEDQAPRDSVQTVMSATGLSFRFQWPDWFQSVWRSVTALSTSIPSPTSPQVSLECLVQKQRTEALDVPSRMQMLVPALWWFMYPASVTFWVVVLCLLAAKVAYPLTHWAAERATRKLTERLMTIGVRSASARVALRDPIIAQRVFKDPLVLNNNYKVVECIGGEVFAEAAACCLAREGGAECLAMLQRLVDNGLISNAEVLYEIEEALDGDAADLENFLRDVFKWIEQQQVSQVFSDPLSIPPVLEDFLPRFERRHSTRHSARHSGRHSVRRSSRHSAGSSTRMSVASDHADDPVHPSDRTPMTESERNSQQHTRASLFGSRRDAQDDGRTTGRRSLGSWFGRVRNSMRSETEDDDEQAHYVVFGLFRDTTVASVLTDAFPLYTVTMYSIWDTVTTRMLGLIQGKTVLIKQSHTSDGRDEVALESRWLYDMRFTLFQGDHVAVALVSIIGLCVWSVGFLVLLFRTLRQNRHNLQERHTARRYGYFYAGLEPNSYWWEVLVKKGDVLLLYVVTYTEVFHDPRAKLIMYMGLAGVFWAAHNMYHPYSKTQNKLADRIEDMGLFTRFATIVILQILLLLNSGKQVNALVAIIIIVANVRFLCTIAFVMCVEMPNGDNSEEKGAEMTKNAMSAFTGGGSNPLTNALFRVLNLLIGYLIQPVVTVVLKLLLKIAQMKNVSAKKVPHLQWQGVGLDLVVVSHDEHSKLPWYERAFATFFTYLYKLKEDQQKSFLAHSIGQFWDHVLNNSGCHQLPPCITDIFFLLPSALKRESEVEHHDHVPFHIRVAKRIRSDLTKSPKTSGKKIVRMTGRGRSSAGVHSAGLSAVTRKTSFHHSEGVPDHTHSGEDFNAALLFIQRLTKNEVHEFIENAEPGLFAEPLRAVSEGGQVGTTHSI